MKKLKIGVIAIVALIVVMVLTSPDKDSHAKEYMKSSSISSKIMSLVKQNNYYGNLFVLSYYKRDGYFAIGAFGKVFVVSSS